MTSQILSCEFLTDSGAAPSLPQAQSNISKDEFAYVFDAARIVSLDARCLRD